MNDCVAVTLTSGDHFVCVVTVLGMLCVSVAAIWRERRAEKRLSRRATERDELAVANANLLEERSNWIFENMLMRAELDEWESEAERRVVESQEGTTDGHF